MIFFITVAVRITVTDRLLILLAQEGWGVTRSDKDRIFLAVPIFYGELPWEVAAEVDAAVAELAA